MNVSIRIGLSLLLFSGVVLWAQDPQKLQMMTRSLMEEAPTTFEARKSYIERILQHGSNLERLGKNLSAQQLYKRGLTIWLNHPELTSRVQKLEKINPLVDKSSQTPSRDELKMADDSKKASVTQADRTKVDAKNDNVNKSDKVQQDSKRENKPDSVKVQSDSKLNRPAQTGKPNSNLKFNGRSRGARVDPDLIADGESRLESEQGPGRAAGFFSETKRSAETKPPVDRPAQVENAASTNSIPYDRLVTIAILVGSLIVVGGFLMLFNNILFLSLLRKKEPRPLALQVNATNPAALNKQNGLQAAPPPTRSKRISPSRSQKAGSNFAEQKLRINTQSLRSMATYIDERSLRPLHSETVCRLAGFIATKLRLSPQVIADVQRAALIMDLGMVDLPEYLFSKTGTLSESEWEIIRKHPEKTLELVHSARYSMRVLNAIASHHERWDGSGYPLGLAGEAIPIEARILGIADTFTAMFSRRSYRPQYTKNQALNFLKKNSSRLFDARMVNALYTGLLEKSHIVPQSRRSHSISS